MIYGDVFKLKGGSWDCLSNGSDHFVFFISDDYSPKNIKLTKFLNDHQGNPMKKIFIHFLLISAVSFTQPLKAADYTNNIGIDFIKIKAGCFNMGRNPNFEDGSDDELPRHQVCLKK